MTELPMSGTYRLQLHAGFTFDDAVAVLDVLADLGISHLYTSPTLAATPGSTHGYDVVDHQRINEELGGEAGHQRLSDALASRGMGRVVDLVPNHMAVGRDNRWWWDVLENGRASRYAPTFDVDWSSGADERILLPILGASYGEILDKGELQLQRDGGSFAVRYWDHLVPIDPGSLGPLLSAAATVAGSDELGFLADSFATLFLAAAHDSVTDRLPLQLAPLQARRRHRNKEVLRRLLERLLREDPDVSRAVDAQVAATTADTDALHALLEAQHHRLAHWRTGRQELDYRRFFDIDTLVGLRMEDPAVFEDTHALVRSHVDAGQVQGLRIDHPDGLRDPRGYLERLRAAAPDAWIVVEKILEPGERLRSTWPVAGTTGYDFLNLALGLFVDPDGEAPLTELYEAFTGEPTDWEAVLVDKKVLVMREGLGSELNRLTELLLQACARHRSHRDHTRRDCMRVLRLIISHFPVYRTYGTADGVEPEDRDVIEAALAASRGELDDIDPKLLDFVGELLRFEHPGEAEEAFALSFQQVTGPVMAKGAEDTAFYCYNRLIALNEVGGSPGRFGCPPERFHAEMAGTSHPNTMRTTSTHDTKRSEDVRVRIAALSEIPERWGRAVTRWAARNERHKTDGLPDRNTEYLLYQTLVGAWPISTERMTAAMEKSAREAKVHTSWARPDPAYEAALTAFVTATLSDEAFCADLEAFVAPLRWAGRVSSLAQALLLATVPGVPDRYQGTELWDLSLVDPDNRRPVDWGLRRGLLRELDDLDADGVMARIDDGLPKLHVVREANRLRARRPAVFGEGGYQELAIQGPKARHCVGIVRGDDVVAVVPRLVVGLCAPDAREPGDRPLRMPDRLAGCWEGTVVELPDGRWRDVLTGAELEGGEVSLDALLDPMPVALLERIAARGEGA